jgi:hypothetical protein
MMRRPTVSKERGKTFDPVNLCIYCGRSDGLLTREHILPIGLGGGLILPAASCRACQDITKNIETKCQRGNLLPYSFNRGQTSQTGNVPSREGAPDPGMVVDSLGASAT